MKRNQGFLAILALIVFFSFSGRETSAQNYRQLSIDATISLMTCGPGAELYSTFGHSALWISDPATRIDRVYNYGTFDFTDPNFYFLFTRGIADYMLSVTSSARFIQDYIDEDRSVEQQILNLTQQEKQMLFEAVEENYKPENRFYRYDFLFLNCSSIIRDKVFETLESEHILDSTNYDQSFRDLLQPYIPNSWLSLGINLLLGHKADKQATNWERMFLPDNMRDQFSLARVQEQTSLAPEIKTLYLSSKLQTETPVKNGIRLTTTVFFLLLVFIGIITRHKYNDKKWNKPLDSLLFFIGGIIGVLLGFMWLFSEHEVIHQNINILWAFPLHLILAIFIWFPSLKRLNAYYSKFILFLSALFLLLTVLGFQEVPTSLLLFAGVLFLRLFRLAFFSNIGNEVQGEQAN